jgi:hypothetical protein
VEAIPEAYLQARDGFARSRAIIEADVAHALRSRGVAHHPVALADLELGLNIDAALALGDMEFLGTDIDWMAGLLRNHRLPPEALSGYLATYHQAAADHLDEWGQPVVAWLGGLLTARPAG